MATTTPATAVTGWRRWLLEPAAADDGDRARADAALLEDDLDRPAVEIKNHANSQNMKKENARSWRSCLRFVGPGYMVAVGYMDPGNWCVVQSR